MASGRAQTEFVEHTASLGGQPPRARRVDPSPPLNLSPNPCPRAHLRIVLSPCEGDERANHVVKLCEPCRTNWRRTEGSLYDRPVRITRCPRCLAEDITADAHPSRRLVDGMPATFFVCRECFRAAELEFQISCEGGNIPYARLPIRESLRLLRGFYQERQRESPDDARVGVALQEIERRLLIGPVERASKLDA